MTDKITEAIKLGNTLHNLRDEFEIENPLYSDCPDGHVTLENVIQYCKENDWLIGQIIKVAKDVNK